MPRLFVILPSIAVLTMAVAAPRALALAQSGRQGSKPRTVYTSSQKSVNLSPIVVWGHHLPIPVAFQVYKKALTRPWSGNPADRGKLVCRWHAQVGTHLQTLFCQTNGQHQKLASTLRSGFMSMHQRAGHNIPAMLAGATTLEPIRRGPTEALLAKLPPANASYTFRVTRHGKPVLDYVIKHGELVHIYHYVYKNGKATKTKR